MNRMGYCSIALICLFVALTNAKNDVDFYSFTVKDIHGKDAPLEKYRGMATLVVNVASECGFTDGHYKGLVKLQNILAPTEKFTILAFPSNQFGAQEPGGNGQILKFAQDRYQVNFPIFSKIKVIEEEADPLYVHLQEQTGQAPNWNFWKYLVAHNGKVLKAWGPWSDIEEVTPFVKQAVDEALKARGPMRPARDIARDQEEDDKGHEPYMESGMASEENSDVLIDGEPSGGVDTQFARRGPKAPAPVPARSPGRPEPSSSGPPPPGIRKGINSGPPPPPKKPAQAPRGSPPPPAPRSPLRDDL